MKKKPANHHGFLLVDKPSGFTSHDVVAKIRKICGQRQVGHTGTLDPLATGLMVVLLGSATKLEPWLTSLPKTYAVQMELGRQTDTDDICGQTIELKIGQDSDLSWPRKAELEEILARYQGPLDQVPPAYSAIKVGGQKAYNAARAGVPLELAPRRVTAHHLELISYAPPLADFTASVSAGFYIRSLVRDMGNELGLGATVSALKRTKVGIWDLAQSSTLETIAAWNPEEFAKGLAPPAEALPHWAAVNLNAAEEISFRQGQSLLWSFDLKSDIMFGDLPSSEMIKVLDTQGRLIGLGEIDVSLGDKTPPQSFLRPRRVMQ